MFKAFFLTLIVSVFFLIGVPFLLHLIIGIFHPITFLEVYFAFTFVILTRKFYKIYKKEVENS